LCECRGTSDDGDYMLLCSLFDTFDYCPPSIDDPDDPPVCASILFGQTFNDNGQVTDRFRNYDYVDERMGTITVQRIDVTNECVVTVNNDQCKSCEIVDTCPDVNSQLNQALYEKNLPSSEELGIFTDIKVDCTNVNAAAIFECGIADGAGNLLNILNGYPVSPDDATRPPAQQTIDPNAFPPTITPVVPPTPSPTSTTTPSTADPTGAADDETDEPSSSNVPSETPGEPTTSPSISMVPSISIAPSVSSPPSGEPTVTGSPTVTAEPTSIESMEPTVAKLTAATTTTTDNSAAVATDSKRTTSVIFLFFSSVIASFFLIFTQ